MVPKFCQNEAKMGPKSNQNGSRVGVGKERCDKNRTDARADHHFKRKGGEVDSKLASKTKQKSKKNA